jgi:hypothetical protein
MGDGDDNARKRRREKLKDMQQRIDVGIRFLEHTILEFIHISKYYKWKQK